MLPQHALLLLATVPVTRLLFKLVRLLRRPRLTPDGNSAPQVIHRLVLRNEMLPGRTIIVGDVHACLEELDLLLQRCQYAPDDNLILAGDLVNKGPFSCEVLARARELGALVVRGNHDDAALAAYHEYKEMQLKKWERKQQRAAGRICQWWPLYNAVAPSMTGGNRSISRLPRVKQVYRLPKYQYVENFTEADINFLEELPFTITLEAYGVVVVHAGLVPGVKLEKQRLMDMCKMRTVKKHAEGRWVAEEQSSGNDSVPWAQVWPGPQHVVFGHDARSWLQLCPVATGLDTGCCYGGQLSALVLPPWKELEASWKTEDKHAAGKGVTREDLKAKVVAVDALHKYEKQKGE